MDDQTAERMAKLAADNLRLRDEVKLLRRQLARAVPVGAPDSNPDRVITAMVDGLGRQASERLAEERLGELEAVQKRYDQLREETVRLQGESDTAIRERKYLSIENDKLRAMLGESDLRLQSELGPFGFRSQAESRLQALEAHCFPKPLDTTDEPSEG